VPVGQTRHAMAVRTTTIGSYPKPTYAPVANGFDQERGAWKPTPRYDELPSGDPAAAALDRATVEVVQEQVALGIDVQTDGEVRREHYIYYHLRHLDGFDFERLVGKVMRGGGWTADVPVVRGPIRAGGAFLPRDWRVAQTAADAHVKMTVPGPLTIAASTADEHYGDARALGAALADALNVEIRRLADAGCRWIQVDEPVFAREPEQALAYGVEHVERCFAGVDADVQRVVHICCGYPAALDQEDYPKADPGTYFELAGALDAAGVDAVSIEDAHRHNDLALLDRFTRTDVILGVVDIARTRVEPVEEIRERLEAAAARIGTERLLAAPDCGLTMLPRQTAAAKLRNLVAAAHGVG
jgi:methionine synthase II (cobalamin-independent)